VSILACAVLLRQTERASQVRGATKDGAPDFRNLPCRRRLMQN